MDKTEFLKICQQVAILPKGKKIQKQGLKKEHIVLYNGVKYYPVGRTCYFDCKGNMVYIAILHDIYANSIVNCDMSEVMPFETE